LFIFFFKIFGFDFQCFDNFFLRSLLRLFLEPIE
jgi:hypothetical protein